MMKTFLRKHPWVIFLVVGLIAQQSYMIAYKMSTQNSTPETFLMYSFMFQAILNGLCVLTFKNRGFPITLQSAFIIPVLLVTLLYGLNEYLFIAIYKIGPYALATIILSVLSLLILVLFGTLILKEKMNRVQVLGVVLTLCAIAMIRLG
jgi:drug/metabolite transporter (DMT)-like permease